MKKVRSGIDRMFEKSLQDLVRLVRNNKHREKEFINEALEGKLVDFWQFSRFLPIFSEILKASPNLRIALL